MMDWHLAATRAPLGFAVTAGFALAARWMRAVTLGGAIAGAAVTFVLFLAWPPSFGVLLAVFLLTSLATRAGLHRKQQLGTAEKRDGRTASQVFANLFVAAAAAFIATYFNLPLLMFGCAGALAEAAADTVSSEMGQAFGSPPVLITTLRPVPVGTDGGITAAGSFAGGAAALIIAGTAMFTGVIPPDGFPIVVVAGVLGMFFDSLLGATVERGELLDNDHVNFSSTLFAASLASLLAKVW